MLVLWKYDKILKEKVKWGFERKALSTDQQKQNTVHRPILDVFSLWILFHKCHTETMIQVQLIIWILSLYLLISKCIYEIIGDSVYRVNYVFWGLPINGFCLHQFSENGIQFALSVTIKGRARSQLTLMLYPN